MRGVGQVGAQNVNSIGGGASNASFSLSNAAGWTMLYWFASVAILLAIFLAL
jgi:hypothetical protein